MRLCLTLNSVERWRENTSKESCERAAKGDAERERERDREREREREREQSLATFERNN